METEEKEKMVIAISLEDCDSYGCPYCGCRSGTASVQVGACAFWDCGKCGRGTILLGEGLKKSAIGIGIMNVNGRQTVYPVLQEHPRKGMPAHGNEDKRPEDNR